MTSKDAPFNFEEALKSLEELVNVLEKGGLSLEESLQAFERGVKLTRECQAALAKAEQKVQLLMEKKDGEEPQAEPFDEHTGDQAGVPAGDRAGEEKGEENDGNGHPALLGDPASQGESAS